MQIPMETLEDRRLMSATLNDSSVTPTAVTVPVIIAAPGTPIPVHAEATEQFTAKLARLPGHTASSVSQLMGSVSWGDGKMSDASFARNSDGTIAVLGTHTYAKKGTYNIDVTISRRPVITPGRPIPFFAVFLGHVKTKATVVADDDGGVSLTEVATQQFTDRIGSFDFRTIDILIDHTTIDWGDGKTSNAKLVREGSLFSGEYDVI